MAFHRSNKGPTQGARAIADKLLDYIPKGQETLRILDVGCGGGEITRSFVERLASARPEMKIHLLAIDPADVILNLARKHLQNLSTNVKVKFKQVGVYPQPAPRLCDLFDRERFDFLLASFMMFWVDDWDDVLEQFLECLKPDGLLCVTLNCRTPGESGASFRQRIFEIAHQETGYQMEFAEDFEEILKTHRIGYRTETVCSDLVLSSMHSDKISEVMEFMMRFPRGELTPHQVEAIKGYTNTMLSSSPLQSCKKMMWVVAQ